MTTAGICGICEYLLAKQDEDKLPVDILKLMELLYYAQSYSLAIRNEPLFDERIQAWRNGPVIPKVYEAYKLAGCKPTGRRTALRKLHCCASRKSARCAVRLARPITRVVQPDALARGVPRRTISA